MTNNNKEQIKKIIDKVNNSGEKLPQVDLRKEKYQDDCAKIVSEGHLLYTNMVKASVVSISHDYHDTDRTLVKLKPDGNANFYIEIEDIDTESEKKFVRAWKNNKIVVLSYSVYSKD